MKKTSVVFFQFVLKHLNILQSSHRRKPRQQRALTHLMVKANKPLVDLRPTSWLEAILVKTTAANFHLAALMALNEILVRV